MSQRWKAACAMLAIAGLGGGCVLEAKVGDNDSTPPTAVAQPPPGVFRAGPMVMLVADEPATIYYTTDGTPATTSSASSPSPVMLGAIDQNTDINFFAVDDAGNVGATAVASYIIDRFGPAPVQDFKAETNGDDVMLTWTNPTAPGFVEVVVARTDDVAASAADDGVQLSQGDAAGAATVINVGTGTSLVDSGPGAGGHTYVIWARYDNDAFSDARIAAAAVGSAPSGQVVVDVAAQTVTASTPLDGFDVSGGAVAFDGTTGTASFDLTLGSSLSGVIFNPKLVVTSLSEGSFADPDCTISGGALDGESCRYYGPAGLTAGSSVTRSFAVSGVTATSVFTLDVSFQSDRGLFVPTWSNTDPGGLLVDFGSAAGYDALPRSPGFYNSIKDSGPSGYRGAVVSADGRYLFAGGRNTAQVLKVDLTTMSAVAGAMVAMTRSEGSISDLRLDPSGTRLFAILNDGMHNGAWRATAVEYEMEPNRARTLEDNTVVLVEIDAATLKETARVTLKKSDAAYRGRRMALSQDGRQAAAAAGSQYADPSISDLYVVDLVTMTSRSVSAAPMRPSQVEFSWDGSYLVCNNSWQADSSMVGIVDLSSESLSLQTQTPSGGLSKAMAFAPRRNGSLWAFGDGSGVTTLEPTDGTLSNVGTDYSYARAVMVDSDGSALVLGYSELMRFDPSDGTATTLATWGTSTFAHSFAITPY